MKILGLEVKAILVIALISIVSILVFMKVRSTVPAIDQTLTKVGM